MKKYRCKGCGYTYGHKIEDARAGLPDGSMLARIDVIEMEEALDEINAMEKTPFEELPDDWVCPICQAPKLDFEEVTDEEEVVEEVVGEKWLCEPCGYVYNSGVGDKMGGIEAGTLFEDLPDSWICPLCGASKEDFSRIVNK